MFKRFIISALSLTLLYNNAQADYQFSSAVAENIMKHLAAKELKSGQVTKSKSHHKTPKISKESEIKNNKPQIKSLLPQKTPVEPIKPESKLTDIPKILPAELPKAEPEMTPITKASPVILEKPSEVPSSQKLEAKPLPAEIAKEAVTKPEESPKAPIEPNPTIPNSPAITETPKISASEKTSKQASIAPNVVLSYKAGEFELDEHLKAQITPILQNKDQRIRIIGYASNDNDNHQSAARRISLQRVITIRKFLIANNYNSALITVQAMGYVKSNQNPERVEIYVDKD